ncbi:MAG: histidine kinase N-terminal domain-containing protein [Bifidobacteriaceae bacterium]|nr:histidine kinase N-terminal domain-containing protein [Bifidobacteriaceae bacterium]
MADLSQILAGNPGFNDADREWLHHLVSDWQVIADLSFADLILVLQDVEGRYVVADQCRSSTVVSVLMEDMIGQTIPNELVPAIESAYSNRVVARLDHYRMVNNNTVCDVFAPVIRHDKVLGVVIRETNMATRVGNGRYELECIQTGKRLFDMIPMGRFPYEEALISERRSDLRVSDGFCILSVSGIVEYASPNAISCYRRLGAKESLVGRYLAEVTTNHIQEHDRVPESLAYVLSGKSAADSELDTSRACLAMRSFPLYGMHAGRDGALVLFRDVTEVRRREVELETKDATISEIHHRVKNNLQAVSALLRLQARRTKSEEVRAELEEAQRRISTIAVVHEGLSQTADENVDFDTIIPNLLRMSADVAAQHGQNIDISFVGQFGTMPAQDATPLSLVLTELVTNAVEHGFEGRESGHITISAGRGGNNLDVVVEDDGNGMDSESEDGMARESGSGLGTQIVQTFVTNDFGGTIQWMPARSGGTRVVLKMKLRAAQ